MRNPFDEPSPTPAIRVTRERLHAIADILDDPDRVENAMHVLIGLRSPIFGETEFVFVVDVQYAPFGARFDDVLPLVIVTAVHKWHADNTIGPRIDTLWYRWPEGLIRAIDAYAAALAVAGYGT